MNKNHPIEYCVTFGIKCQYDHSFFTILNSRFIFFVWSSSIFRLSIISPLSVCFILGHALFELYLLRNLQHSTSTNYHAVCDHQSWYYYFYIIFQSCFFFFLFIRNSLITILLSLGGVLICAISIRSRRSCIASLRVPRNRFINMNISTQI